MRTYTRVPVEERFWKYVNKTDTCWLWTGAIHNSGYGIINTGGKNGKAKRAHRISWAIHYGPIPDGMCVCHHCDTPACVNPEHLFLGTRDDNNQDMKRKGRYNHTRCARGERHWYAKLTDKQVLEIRYKYETDKPTLRSLADEYGVTPQAIHRIVRRRLWRHV